MTSTISKINSIAGYKTPHVLLLTPGPVVSVVVNLAIPFNVMLRKTELSITYQVSWLCTKKDIDSADVLIFCRPTTEFDLKALVYAKNTGKCVIVNYDDYFLQVPAELPHGRAFAEPARRKLIETFYSCADQLQVYSHRHAELAAVYTSKVTLMRQFFDRRILKGIEVTPVSASDGLVHVAFPTSRGQHDYLSKLFREAFTLLEPDVRERLRLHVWGGIPDPLQGLSGIVVEPYQPNYTEFVRAFYAKGFDFGLAPIADDTHHRCKTEVKFREYGGCGVPGIYSDVPPYRGSVTHEETGLLVPNDARSWSDAITRMAQDLELRRRLTEKAREDSSIRYDLAAAIAQWRSLLSNILDAGPRPMPPPALPARSLTARLRKPLGMVYRWLHYDRTKDWLRSLTTY